MQQIDRQEFGCFLAKARKEKGLTQKQLAQRLFVSDKAVSKWERGLSLPDIELLTPLARELDVTVTELLQARDLSPDQTLPVHQVEDLVTGSLELAARNPGRQRRAMLWTLCTVGAGLEILVLYLLGLGPFLKHQIFWTLELLALLFGGWFWLTGRIRLPAYYDENKIGFVSDGIFRLNMAGMRFNNRNWPHILRAGRIWGMAASLLYPVLYGLVCGLVSSLPSLFYYGFSALFLVSLFGSIVWTGKKYE